MSSFWAISFSSAICESVKDDSNDHQSYSSKKEPRVAVGLKHKVEDNADHECKAYRDRESDSHSRDLDHGYQEQIGCVEDGTRSERKC